MAFLEPITQTKAELRELGSRFYGYVFPVVDADAIDEQLALLHKQYPDATHICYAYRLGTQADVYRASDDGEPKYSAGVPILNQIKSANMTNVLVAVVRYYGGTNLGVPGLVKAYGGAAAEALALAQTQEALDSFQENFTVLPAKVGIVYDLARKAGATVEMLDIQNDGSQTLVVKGKGSSENLVQALKEKLS